MKDIYFAQKVPKATMYDHCILWDGAALQKYWHLFSRSQFYIKVHRYFEFNALCFCGLKWKERGFFLLPIKVLWRTDSQTSDPKTYQ